MYLLVLALQSILHFVWLVFEDNLHLRKDRLGKIYTIKNHGNYKIFRETESSKHWDQQPVTLFVGFRLKVLDNNPFMHWLFERVCICTTPFWSGFAGFHIKLWMVDPKSRNYAGIYSWYGENNAQKYVNALVRVLKPLSTTNSVWYEIKTKELSTFV